MKLEVAATTDPGVSVGQSAYAVEMPGTALIIKPAGQDTRPPIVAASLGTNPAGPQVSFNYVDVAKSGWAMSDEAYGHVTFDVNGNSYGGTADRFEIDNTPMSQGFTGFTSVDGHMTANVGGVIVNGVMTPSGVCVMDYGPGMGGFIGVKQPSAPTNLVTLGTKSFRGFLINQGKTQCVTVTPNGDGTLHGTGYQNPSGVETGTSDGGAGVTITFLSQPNPGQITMSIGTSGGAETLVACVSVVNGKTMLFAFGAGGGEPYNVLLVEN